MSKRQRGFQAPDPGAGGTSTPPGTSDVAPTGAEGAAAPAPTSPPAAKTASSSKPPTTRSAARRRSPAPRASQQSFFDRYRAIILGGAVVLVVGVVGLFFFRSASAAPYECIELMTPGPVAAVPTPRPATPTPSIVATAAPTAAASPDQGAEASPDASAPPSAAATVEPSATPSPTPEPQPTQQLGFPTRDMGAGHAGANASVTYEFCPPTSGEHFNIAGQAPLRRDFYGPNTALRPGNWVHNLEHGYVVLLYRGDPGTEILRELERIMEDAPGSPGSEICGVPNKVIAVRFDDMDVPFAAVSWDRALLLEEWDPEQLAIYAQQWQDSPAAPERGVC